MLEKKQIILMVQELGRKIGNADLGELFQDDKTQGDKKIGHGQFRELAQLCVGAECYEEIELHMKYNTAKAKPRQSWAKECQECNNQKFGELIVGYMKTIRDTEQNDSDVLKDLNYFFGYLYWQSRVWSMENPTQNNNQGRNSGNNQNRTESHRDKRPNNGYGKQNSQYKGGYK